MGKIAYIEEKVAPIPAFDTTAEQLDEYKKTFTQMLSVFGAERNEKWAVIS